MKPCGSSTSFNPSEVDWDPLMWHLAQYLVSPGLPCGLSAGGGTINREGTAMKPGGATMVPHDPAPVLAVRPAHLDQTIGAAMAQA